MTDNPPLFIPGDLLDGPDPDAIHTADDLAAALKALAGARSYADISRAARGKLPKSTLSDVFGKGRPSRETLELILRACLVPRDRWLAWQKARDRAISAIPELVGLTCVEQADARRLGVHAAIDAPGAIGDLPDYVLRDTDTAPGGVRALLAKAAGRGGMVLLVGGSSVGKSRCAYEALRAVMPHWWLLHPADAEQVRQAAAQPPARLVVWLDELQRYLGGPVGLNAGTVRTLLQARAVLIATMWPERYTAYTALPMRIQADVYAAERELLDLADVVHLPASFSAEEQKRAQAAAAAGDQRITIALRSNDYGLTQTIAAAPQLVDRWRGADPYAAAVLNAAIDATRLGALSPLSTDLIRSAAPGYCDARQRAAAPTTWFETALAYATTDLNGAAAALAPIANPNAMGHTTGYLVADYLQQHAGHQRRPTQVPTTCWQALVDHLTDPGDQTRVAHAAQNRLLDHYAKPLYRRAIHAGNGQAASLLAGLLAGQGQLADALALWRARADAGEDSAATTLTGLLDEQDRVEEALAHWQARADADGRSAIVRLTGLLVACGRAEEAVPLWQTCRDAGDQSTPVRPDNQRDSQITADELAEALMTAVEIKSPYTRQHSERMAELVVMIGYQIGMPHERMQAARLAGLLHDIGKFAIPSTVLHKEGRLTEEEYRLIQGHVTHGVSIVAKLVELLDHMLEPAARQLLTDAPFEGILHHHERFDGRGYPKGLAGQEIPQIARVIAVADAFDSLTTHRSYRSARTIPEAVTILRGEVGRSLDPEVVEAFLTIFESHADQMEQLAWSCPACNCRMTGPHTE
ncbi:HD-GYP domain-containing protein [Sphaerisporangium sp. NBC_01403]|uniref:HD-GYP domain-containing protein n=1 Tax=Sphaerisporangium sp. NBC_01403 TaxID=2903599 RepID=UPI003253E907